MKKIVIKDENRFSCIFIVSLILITFSLIMVGISYAYDGVASYNNPITFSLTTPSLSVELNNTVYLTSLEPVADVTGINNPAYEYNLFITNKDKNDLGISLKFSDVKGSNSDINPSEIRFQLICNDTELLIGNLANKLNIGTIEGHQSLTCKLKFWLGLDATTQNGTFIKKLDVVATTDDNLDVSNANPPQLDGLENMIPVYYENGKWYKADESNTIPKYKWYDYDKGMWANVVTVYENNREKYIDAKLGTQIYKSDINSFFVWIPRYKYTVMDFDEKNFYKGFNIEFEKGVQRTSTVKCNSNDDRLNTIWTCDNVYTGTSTITPDGFIFDNEELTGFWISKYQASTPLTSSVEGEYSLSVSEYGKNLSKDWKNTLSMLTFIPDSKLLHGYDNIDIIFRMMEFNSNQYGFSQESNISIDNYNEETITITGEIPGDSNNFDIHLAKNSEIAALTYLTYSQYGRFSSNKYNKTNINGQNLGLVFSIGLPTNSNTNTIKSGSSRYNDRNYSFMEDEYVTLGTSTTGNIYGVFDTSFEIGGQTFWESNVSYWKPNLSNGSNMYYGYNVATGNNSWKNHNNEVNTYKLDYWEPLSNKGNILAQYGSATYEFMNKFSAKTYSGKNSVIPISSEDGINGGDMVRLNLTTFYTCKNCEVYAGFAIISPKQDVYKNINVDS